MGIVVAFIQIIKCTAKIAERSFRPVVLIDDLHFEIQDLAVVEKDFDIQIVFLASIE